MKDTAASNLQIPISKSQRIIKPQKPRTNARPERPRSRDRGHPGRSASDRPKTQGLIPQSSSSEHAVLRWAHGIGKSFQAQSAGHALRPERPRSGPRPSWPQRSAAAREGEVYSPAIELNDCFATFRLLLLIL